MHRDPKYVSQGAWVDLALHTLGWKAFQDLCAHVCEEVLQRPVKIFREAQDGGQDAVFLSKKRNKKLSKPATIQCKFSAKPGKTLGIADVARESLSIEALVKSGEASTYVFMTNMSSSAKDAKIIKDRLRSLGVEHPHVFAKEWMTRVIRSNARLRALVPRIYGLGDLSVILDERRAAQTRALLGHMIPTLKVYVPTKPHVKAVRSISEHGIVLLLGGPGVGKSTIAAILSTIASENENYRCYKIDSPFELPDNWNPHEGETFFWIDDAFGPNQLREDYVDRWIQIMPKIQAAIAGGSKFVLTSRTHLYEAAAPKLGSRNHPLLREGDAVVQVGALTRDEKRQILYNHIKCGNQSSSWKAGVKPYLDHLTSESSFLSEIARRLGDRSYTRKLDARLDALTKFIREPQEHLLQTILELSKINRAALTLVFLHRSRMPIGAPLHELQQLVVSHFGVANEELGQAIAHMQDSFVAQRVEGADRFWTFKHPTISDALSAMLSKTLGMSELYIRGVKPHTLLSEVVSHGIKNIKDAIFVDERLNDLLA